MADTPKDTMTAATPGADRLVSLNAVLRVFDAWRINLPPDRGFTHGEGRAFVQAISALSSPPAPAELRAGDPLCRLCGLEVESRLGQEGWTMVRPGLVEAVREWQAAIRAYDDGANDLVACDEAMSRTHAALLAFPLSAPTEET